MKSELEAEEPMSPSLGAPSVEPSPDGSAATQRRAPRVSIGMPVYNAEDTVARALDSFLAQTVQDIEIVISDNASEDATGEICRAYAERDSRIRYVRNPVNIGISRNFNQAFELSSAEYFKWAAHDDWCAPTFLERCIAELDADPDAVIAYADTVFVDADGAPVAEATMPDYGSSSALRRGHRWLRTFHGTPPAFGLIRASALRTTRLCSSGLSASRVLWTELILIGPWRRIREPLLFCFVNRRGGDTFAVNANGDGASARSHGRGGLVSAARTSLADPRNAERTPMWVWRYMGELAGAVARSPAPFHVKAVLVPEAIVRTIRAQPGRLWAELKWFVTHRFSRRSRALPPLGAPAEGERPS
jgi:hypothetical protein